MSATLPSVLESLGLLAAPRMSAIGQRDLYEYISLDVVLEDTRVDSPHYVRQAPFRTLAKLDQIMAERRTLPLNGGPFRTDPDDPLRFQTRVRMQLVFPANPVDVAQPVSRTQLPLAVLVHGNHRAYEVVSGTLVDKESFRGYRYLQDHLAGAGIASISVDMNFAWLLNSWIELRADLTLAAIDLLKRQTLNSDDPLYRRIDFTRIGLMGHSRGGDAIVRAIKKRSSIPGGDRLRIRTACSLAPTDFSGQDPVNRVVLNSSDVAFYSVLYGALDGDVTGFLGGHSRTGTGFRHYDRARCQKALVFAPQCCHNSFNSVWHADGIESGVRSDDRAAGRLADESTHQQVAQTYIGGQFAWHLKRRRAEAALFNGTKANPTGLAPAILWSFGTRLMHIDDFENPNRNRVGRQRTLSEGAAVGDFASMTIPQVGPVSDHVLHQRRLVHAHCDTSDGSSVRLVTRIGARWSDWSGFTTLALDAGAFFDTTSETTIAGGTAPTFSVTLHDANGGHKAVPGRAFSPPIGRPFFHEVVRRDGNGVANVTALRLDTLSVPLTSFTGVDLHNIESVQVDVSPPAGDLFLDDIKVLAF